MPYFVTIETIDDGTLWDAPEVYDCALELDAALPDLRRRAPEGYEVVVYDADERCRHDRIADPNADGTFPLKGI